MSRKPAAPKPEELIAKLDEKFESFKEEITQSLEDRTADIEKANQNNVEVRDLIDKHREEDKKELDSVKNTLEQLVERKLEDVQRYIYRVPQKYRLKEDGSEGHKNGSNQILILCMFFSTSGHLV